MAHPPKGQKASAPGSESFSSETSPASRSPLRQAFSGKPGIFTARSPPPDSEDFDAETKRLRALPTYRSQRPILQGPGIYPRADDCLARITRIGPQPDISLQDATGKHGRSCLQAASRPAGSGNKATMPAARRSGALTRLTGACIRKISEIGMSWLH